MEVIRPGVCRPWWRSVNINMRVRGGRLLHDTSIFTFMLPSDEVSLRLLNVGLQFSVTTVTSLWVKQKPDCILHFPCFIERSKSHLLVQPWVHTASVRIAFSITPFIHCRKSCQKQFGVFQHLVQGLLGTEGALDRTTDLLGRERLSPAPQPSKKRSHRLVGGLITWVQFVLPRDWNTCSKVNPSTSLKQVTSPPCCVWGGS